MKTIKPLRAAVGAAALACALAAVPFGASAGASSPVTSNVSAEVALNVPEAPTLSVADVSGKATELLGKLTIPQLASILKVTPAQLESLIDKASGTVIGSIESLLSNPRTTLHEVLTLLGENGVGASSVEHAMAPLVAAATETADGLRSAIASALADLTEDGGIAELAHELALAPAALEGAGLTAGTASQAASALGTTASQLGSLLGGAGAIAAPLASSAPVVTGPVERITENTTRELVGTPSGTGGVTVTNVYATTPGSTMTAGGAAGFKSATGTAFSILSVKVTKSGAILETVRVPGPGHLSVTASASKPLARRSAHTRSRTHTVKVASAARNTTGGTLTLTLRPHGIGRASRTRVTLATTYTPAGGPSHTLTRTVTISRRGSRRHG